MTRQKTAETEISQLEENSEFPKARLWIEDNGIGITPRSHQRIFYVFERLDKVNIYPTIGIGLTLGRKGVERIGGNFGVESQIRQGSRFWLELPKASHLVPR